MLICQVPGAVFRENIVYAKLVLPSNQGKKKGQYLFVKTSSVGRM